MADETETFEEWRERTAPPPKDEPESPRYYVRAAVWLIGIGLVMLAIGGPADGPFLVLGVASLLVAAVTAWVPEKRSSLVYSSVWGAGLLCWILFKVLTDRFDVEDTIGYGIGLGLLAVIGAWGWWSKRRVVRV